jgi:polyribonucleotide nucleotidyltransferase
MIDRPIRPLWPKGFRNEVQCIATILSADMVVAHDILCINGVSAALMISSLPFFGPVGAVRIALIDGQFVVNPTLQEAAADENTLDLIVVGTKDALTMIEAGANEVGEDQLLEALELAHQEIRRICEVQEELRARVGKPKWLDMDLTAELEREVGGPIWDRIQRDGLVKAGAIVEEIVSERLAPLSMESTEDDITKQLQYRQSLNLLLEKQRLVAVETAVREQFESDIVALSDAEQDSKELKSAKRSLLVERILEEVKLPFPVSASEPTEAGEPVKDALTKQFVKKAVDSLYKQVVRRKIAVDKRRPDGRGTEEIRQIAVEVGINPRAHGSGLFTRGHSEVLSSFML